VILAYRLCSGRYAANSPEGSRLYGGRWNPVGTGVIYSSSNPSLAALEILTQYDLLPTDFVLTQIEVPETVNVRVVEDMNLPVDWQAEPPSQRAGGPGEVSTAQLFGLLWTKQQSSGVLSVPSAVMGTDWPTERNYVINPQHIRFSSIKFADPKPFRFDPRLK
jgi:RES domain-containing protein